MQAHNQTDSAFLDIAANMLAIILIITLFSLVTVQHHTHSSTQADAIQDPPLRFVEPQRDLFPPFSRFFFVVEDRVVAWDQSAIIDTLSTSGSGTTEQGRFRWLAEPLTPRDIDTYALNFFPERQRLLDQPALSSNSMDAFVSTLSQDYVGSHLAPVFIVYPSGMEIFAQLYPQLQDAQLRFRWFARNEGAPLYIGRHPAQFTDYAIYW